MEALVGDDLLEEAETLDTADLVLGQEDHANAVATFATEVDAGLCGHVGQETVGNLDRQARAVAAVLLGTGGAAMLQIDEDG